MSSAIESSLKAVSGRANGVHGSGAEVKVVVKVEVLTGGVVGSVICVDNVNEQLPLVNCVDNKGVRLTAMRSRRRNGNGSGGIRFRRTGITVNCSVRKLVERTRSSDRCVCRCVGRNEKSPLPLTVKDLLLVNENALFLVQQGGLTLDGKVKLGGTAEFFGQFKAVNGIGCG